MPLNKSNKEYLYSLKSILFRKLIFASDEEFDFVKEKNPVSGYEGIRRLNSADVKTIFGIDINGSSKITVVDRTAIFGNIEISEKVSNGLLFINSKINDVIIKKAEVADSIHIMGSVAGLFSITQSALKNINLKNSEVEALCLSNNSDAGYFLINNSKVGKVYISKDTFTDNFDINSNSSISEFEIGGRSLISNFWVENNCNIGSFRLSEDSFVGDFFIKNGNKVGNIIIESGASVGDFLFEYSSVLKFIAEGLYSNFQIIGSDISLLSLKSCFIPEFKMKQLCKIEAYINDGRVNIVDFRETAISKEAVISFSGTQLSQIYMENFAQLGNLYFRRIKCSDGPLEWFEISEKYPEVYKEDLKNKEIWKLNENIKLMLELKRNIYYENLQSVNKLQCKKEPVLKTFLISQSSLGKTEFSDCDLSGFNFEFNNSKIIDCFITGGTLPGEKSNKEKVDGVSVFGEKKGSEKWHEQRASFFSQLKSIFQAHGNISRATFYHSKWAEEQKSLFENKGGFLSFFDERFSLWLGKCSSNHGESWKKALRFLLFIPLFCYIPFLANMGILTVDNLIDWNMIFNYFEFLNPVHKPDFFDGKVIKGFAIFFDILGRIVSSYGIYQFILSFRKFSRK